MMKKHHTKRKKKRTQRVFAHQQHQPLTPNEAVALIRQAEEHVLPIIESNQLPAGAALFLMTLTTQGLLEQDRPDLIRRKKPITINILDLWQTGQYVPGKNYPYTLEETRSDLDEGLTEPKDYSAHFKPFFPLVHEPLQGLGEITAGLVRHPQTHLWQIWWMLDETCIQLAAYHDLGAAQRGLREVIHMLRSNGLRKEIEELQATLSTQEDGAPLQIPFDMMHYLLENIHTFHIKL